MQMGHCCCSILHNHTSCYITFSFFLLFALTFVYPPLKKMHCIDTQLSFSLVHWGLSARPEKSTHGRLLHSRYHARQCSDFISFPSSFFFHTIIIHSSTLFFFLISISLHHFGFLDSLSSSSMIFFSSIFFLLFSPCGIPWMGFRGGPKTRA